MTTQDDTGTPAPNGADSDSAAATPAPTTDEKKYWLDQPGNVSKIYYSLLVVCLLLLGADLLYDKHAEHPLEQYFGFSAFFGFVSYVFIVFAAKQLRKIVMRPEDYYDR
ncbi:MAG: hypothetical protein IH849_16070 [Acidobacteria bacterium]|nr:hypothetical protein [Acidobacteriota bacterium]